MAGKDAVLSALGHTDLKESYIVTDAAKALTTAMSAVGVDRLAILSSTLVAPGGSVLTKIPRYITRHALNDSAAMERVVRSTDLAWTVVRLVRLTNKDQTAYRVFEGEPPSVSAAISRATVAAAVLDLVADESYVKETKCICGSH